MTTGYDLDASEPKVAAVLNDFRKRSEAAEGLSDAGLDIAYGLHPRHRLDVFSAGQGSPAVIFFHGGYWRWGSKDERRFLACEWNRQGVSWIGVNYRIVPANSLADAVSDARASVAWIADHAEGLGIDGSRLHVTGNSAGAHLAAMVAAADWGEGESRPEIASLLVISGLFDLVPLLQASANDWLQLTPESAEALSPCQHMPPPDLPILVCWGGDETEAFAFQSRNYADICRASGNEVELFVSPGADHFDMIGELGTPGTQTFERFMRLVAP